MDYRILFVYSDSSASEKYAATRTDVENLVVQELRKVMEKGWSVTIHVSDLTNTQPQQL